MPCEQITVSLHFSGIALMCKLSLLSLSAQMNSGMLSGQ